MTGTVKRHLIDTPRSEVNMWALFVIGVSVLFIVWPPLALLAIPWAIYLVSLRQRAKRQRRQGFADRAESGNSEYLKSLGLNP